MRGQQPGDRHGGRHFLNAIIFAALALMLLAAIVLSLPAARTALPLEGLLGKLPPIPAVLTSAIRVTEVQTSNGATLPDDTGAFSDWIELTNMGDTAASLMGYGLSDREDRIKFTCPDITLAPGASIIIWASGVERLDTSTAPHAAFKLSSLGETIYLTDHNGDLVESIIIPSMPRDESYARVGSRWHRTDSPTPGYENTDNGRSSFLASITRERSGLVLNEIMASNARTILDENGIPSDWIELFNGSPLTIDLSRYALSDDPTRPIKWRFPEGATIAPYGTFVVFASGTAGGPVTRPHAPFKLRSDHGAVILTDLSGQVVDSTEYDNLPTDKVWARRRNTEPWEQTGTPTPGMINP